MRSISHPDRKLKQLLISASPAVPELSFRIMTRHLPLMPVIA